MNDEKIRQKLIEDYWLNKLAGIERKPMSARSTEVISDQILISKEVIAEVSRLGKGNVLSEFVVYFTCFAILLRKYFPSFNNLVAVPAMKNNNQTSDEEHLLFIKINFSESDTLKQCIQQIQQELVVAAQNSYCYENLKVRFADKRIDEENIFQFSFYSNAINKSTSLLSKSGWAMEMRQTDAGQKVILRAQAFQEDFAISQFLQHYLVLLENVRQELSTVVTTIPILSPAEEEFQHQLGEGFWKENEEKTIVDYFEKQAINNPDGIALEYLHSQYTYRELNEKSNKLAHYLIKEGICCNVLVGVLLKKSDWVIISLLAILKSGNAFVPIDMQNPEQRIRYILEDSNITTMIVSSESMFTLPDFSGRLIAIDIEMDTLDTSTINPVVKPDSEDLAYVIYTSGTTGKPKGVMIPHRSLANYASWFIESFKISSTDSSVLLASHAFDLGYTSILGTLLSGACLHIFPDNYLHDPDRMLEYFSNKGISFLKLTPSLFYMLVESSAFKTTPLTSLRLVLLGGESIRYNDIMTFSNRHSHVVFVNHYGPTETTIGVITETIDIEKIRADGRVVIGKPIRNSRIVVLDPVGRLVPLGVNGELCIAGTGLANGYLNKQELTDQKFFLYGSTRFYRTGDFGRWTTDGRIVFLGRKDNQVKINGHRIEVKEIERFLLSYEGVSEAVLVSREGKDKLRSLVAYIKSSGSLDVSALRVFLGNCVPDYMIPSYFVSIKHFPLTPNGKLDYSQLPDPSFDSLANQQRYAAPMNDTHLKMVAIWEEVLERTKIGITDNVFELGANSLKIVRAFKLVNEKFPDSLKITDLFDYPNVSEQSALISTRSGQCVNEQEVQVINF